MNELLRKTATEQSKALKNKEISAVELTKAAFERINNIENKIGAFNSLTENTALETAKKVDEKIAKGEELP
ncbi:Asp-tRNA(Asn)/Glu-tRNA(Gln) amidotransferase subunit GatA, partial [bacterium]|nr:Asp-tRNA(Asn)/Glu-tRNA(Gln) amidotransferase subunit GatA [bacterium]